MDIDKIELTLEADGGAGTVPMIHLTSSFHADVREWTRQLHAEAALTMELWYYNEKFNIWEPLVEPVIEEDGNRRSWQMEAYVSPFCWWFELLQHLIKIIRFQVMQHNEFEDTGDLEIVRQPPKMTVAIVATDNLQLTVTKTLLDLTKELGDVSMVWIFHEQSYSYKNCLGLFARG